jgi:arylformamidase
MIAQINHNHRTYKVDLSKPIDISIPMTGKANDPLAWYVDPIKIEAVKTPNFIGEVKQGAPVNFRNIFFNPHGNATHTESVGHITKELNPVNKLITQYFFMAELISVQPENSNGDFVITQAQFAEYLAENPHQCEAVIIRTLPNTTDKLHKNYSNTNPPYLSKEAAEYLRTCGFKHLLIDLPSVDREEDGGKLEAHRAFWNYPENPRYDCSITELIYVPDSVADGRYFLNISFPNFENDASPSRPLLFKVEKV